MSAAAELNNVVYRDPDRPIEDRVDDLIQRMTVPEKVAQLGSAWVFQLVDGTELCDGAPVLMADGLGQVTRLSGASNLGAVEAATAANAIQRHLVEQTRLGIPAIIHEEVCAGLMSRDATVFPQPIGLACTWDPSAVEAMASVVRAEMLAIGARQGLSPVLDVCRDPRWGRIEETFGEDQHLVAQFGDAFVRGLQSNDLAQGVVATAKHFVGYGASDGGLNWAPARLPERELREVYLHPFESAVRNAKVRSVMNAYHELDGVPCGADRGLLTGVLRDEWGFEGCVVSDYFSIRQLETYHQLVDDDVAAAGAALDAGLDVELPSTDCFSAQLVDAVASGRIPERDVDRALRRVLTTKFELGLFERPFADPQRAAATVGSSDHVDLARSLVRRSIVLLRNDGTLPLVVDPADTDTIAVIGPTADDARNLFGDYSYIAHVESLLATRGNNVFSMPIPEHLHLTEELSATRTVLDALRDRYGDRVRYARGCDVNTDSREQIDEAVAVATGARVAIVVVGDKSGLVDDCTCGETCDRASLDLPGVQEELVEAILATGTPVVLVLVTGRPCGSVSIHERSAAVVAAWMPGSEGADAIADVLTGAHNPSAKLAVTFPRSAGHVPAFYRHKVSGVRSHWKVDYADAPVSPLYPFGHGLSYTAFTVDTSAPTPATVSPHDSVNVRAVVTNTGARDGDEVVQVYVRDPRASVTRPVRELKAFAVVPLAAGTTRTVDFVVPVAQLGFYDRTMRYVVEPGEIEVFVGTSSATAELAGTFTVITSGAAIELDKAFAGTVTVV